MSSEDVVNCYFVALHTGHNERVKHLLETKQISINDRSNGLTALHIALKTNNYTLLEYLASQPDINPNLEDNNGDPPLFYIVQIEKGKELPYLRTLLRIPTLDLFKVSKCNQQTIFQYLLKWSPPLLSELLSHLQPDTYLQLYNTNWINFRIYREDIVVQHLRLVSETLAPNWFSQLYYGSTYLLRIAFTNENFKIAKTMIELGFDYTVEELFLCFKLSERFFFELESILLLMASNLKDQSLLFQPNSDNNTLLQLAIRNKMQKFSCYLIENPKIDEPLRIILTHHDKTPVFKFLPFHLLPPTSPIWKLFIDKLKKLGISSYFYDEDDGNTPFHHFLYSTSQDRSLETNNNNAEFRYVIDNFFEDINCTRRNFKGLTTTHIALHSQCRYFIQLIQRNVHFLRLPPPHQTIDKYGNDRSLVILEEIALIAVTLDCFHDLIIAIHASFPAVLRTAKTPNGDTLLHLAAKHNNLKILRFLLLENELLNNNINDTNLQQNTPLHVAIHASSLLSIIQLLIKAGSSLLSLNKQGETPFHRSIILCKSSITHLLFDPSIPIFIHQITTNNESSLSLSLRSPKNIDLTRSLLENGADPFHNVSGSSLLFIALKYQNLEACILLLQFAKLQIHRLHRPPSSIHTLFINDSNDPDRHTSILHAVVDVSACNHPPYAQKMPTSHRLKLIQHLLLCCKYLIDAGVDIHSCNSNRKFAWDIRADFHSHLCLYLLFRQLDAHSSLHRNGIIINHQDNHQSGIDGDDHQLHRFRVGDQIL